MKEKVEAIYLDYFNNFLSVEGFASYYNMATDKASRVINIGRRLNHRRSL